jgi:hypothetical protein
MLQIDQSVGDGSYQGEIDATGFGSVEGRVDVSERSRVLATRSAASRTPACQATFDAIAWSIRNFMTPIAILQRLVQIFEGPRKH